MGGVGQDNIIQRADTQLVSRFIRAGIQRHHPRLPPPPPLPAQPHNTHTRALNTAPLPLMAESTFSSGAAPSQRGKVCSDGDQTERRSLEEREASIIYKNTEKKEGATGAPVGMVPLPTSDAGFFLQHG